MKICFIAQFPPPMHGLSKAVETLYTSELNIEFARKGEYEFEKVDITSNKRIFSNLFKIINSNAELFYLTISQTKWGNLRDLIILSCINLKRKKCVIHLHGGYYRILVDRELSKIQRKWNYYLVSKLGGTIVLSDSLKENFKGMINEKNIFTVENCVDNQFVMSKEQYENKIDRINQKNIFKVLWLSNFIESKGYTKVLEMARLEKERVKRGEKQRFHFEFAGKFFDKVDENNFFEYIKDNDLKEYVTFHGIVGGEEKKMLLRDSDIFILLTTYPKEGQPISILEAMANGLTIVTTDHAGIGDIVENNVNGILLSTDELANIKKIYTKILKLTRENYKKYANTNYQYSLSNYSEKTYISKMKNVFERVK